MTTLRRIRDSGLTVIIASLTILNLSLSLVVLALVLVSVLAKALALPLTTGAIALSAALTRHVRKGLD